MVAVIFKKTTKQHRWCLIKELQLCGFWKRRFGDRGGGFDFQFGEQVEVPVLRRVNTPGRRCIALYQMDRIAFAAKEVKSLRS